MVGGNLLAGLHETFSDADGLGWFDVPDGKTAQLVVALGFMLLLAVINLRGVGESVKFNVVLTHRRDGGAVHRHRDRVRRRGTRDR